MRRHRSPSTRPPSQQSQRPRIDEEQVSPSSKLPSDILRCIFEFLPLRPRILVLSAVSKRWRQAALLSVKSIEVDSQASQRALRLFPCLTHLTILYQSLTLLPDLLDLPALRALSAFECRATNVPEEVLTTLLSLCRSSLKYLHLTFIQSQGPSLANFLLKISSQPWSLTSLSLAFYEGRDSFALEPFLKLIERVAPQLESLTLHGLFFSGVGPFDVMTFPLLKRLIINDVIRPRDVTQLSSRCPQLEGMSVKIGENVLDELNAVDLPALTEVSTIASKLPREIVEYLSRFPRLQCFRSNINAEQVYRVFVVPRKLTYLIPSLSFNNTSLAVMREVSFACENVTELAFDFIQSSIQINMPDIALKKVESCRVDFYQMPEDVYIHLWRQILRACPRLKFAFIRVMCALESLDIIEKLLLEMQQHGVTRVRLSFLKLSAVLTERVNQLRHSSNGWMRVSVEMNS